MWGVNGLDQMDPIETESRWSRGWCGEIGGRGGISLTKKGNYTRRIPYPPQPPLDHFLPLFYRARWSSGNDGRNREIPLAGRARRARGDPELDTSGLLTDEQLLAVDLDGIVAAHYSAKLCE